MLEMQEIQVWSLGREDPLETEIATHSSIFAWKVPQTVEPGRLQSMGLQRVGYGKQLSMGKSKFVMRWGQCHEGVYSVVLRMQRIFWQNKWDRSTNGNVLGCYFWVIMKMLCLDFGIGTQYWWWALTQTRTQWKQTLQGGVRKGLAAWWSKKTLHHNWIWQLA